MAKVQLTANLKKYFPEQSLEVPGATILEVLDNMEKKQAHFKNYILDEHNHIREHVNIFVDGEMLKDKKNTNLEITKSTQLHIMQALSGG